MQGLTALDISTNEIEEAGAVSISKLQGLTYLDLSDSHIGVVGAAAISKLQGLTYLNLKESYISDGSDEGAQHISNMQGLTYLNLYQVDIGVGVRSISKMQGLKTLCIGSTGMVSNADIYISNMQALSILKVNYAMIVSGNCGDGVNSFSGMEGLTSLVVHHCLYTYFCPDLYPGVFLSCNSE